MEGETAILHRVPSKACLGRDLKGMKGLVTQLSGGSAPGRESSRCKGPGAGARLPLRNVKESAKGGECGWSGLSQR